MRSAFLFCLLMLPFTTLRASQTLTEDAACTAVVQQAVLIADAVCAETGRNEACYGNNHVEAEWREDVLSSPFDLPGHRVEISALSRLQTLPLSLEDAEWGVSLMKAQVDLPDALPGTNSLFLLFGDATLTPSARSPVPMQVFRLETGITGLRCQEAAANSNTARSRRNCLYDQWCKCAIGFNRLFAGTGGRRAGDQHHRRQCAYSR
jgi:hypothetical protein